MYDDKNYRVKHSLIWVRMLCCVCLSLLLCICGLDRNYANTYAEEQTELGLYAKAAVLMDAESGRVLYDKNGSEQLPMASTTKIMTCILALEYASLDDTLTISARAAGMPKVHLGVQEGERFRLEDILYSLMLESHNDSAVAVAEHISGSVEAFAALMNQKARDIGCYDTYFLTPNGLDAQGQDAEGKTVMHHTTARDLARIMRYCIMESPMRDAFLKITQTQTYSFADADGKRQFSCTNHNAFLTMMDGALSGKTGFTAKAGYCYVGALKRDDRTFVVALLACGWPNNKTYKWADTRALMNYGLDNYTYQNIEEEPQLPKIEVTEGIDEENPFAESCTIECVMEETEKPCFLMRKGEEAEIRVQTADRLQAPVAKGQAVGSVQYVLDGQVMEEYKVTAAEEVRRKDFFWCVHQTVHFFLAF